MYTFVKLITISKRKWLFDKKKKEHQGTGQVGGRISWHGQGGAGVQVFDCHG